LIIAQAFVSDQGHAGFLPTRGSFMLDFVFVAMFAIVIVMAISIWLVRSRRQYRWHKRIQIATALTLLVTIVAFEYDIRFLTEWRELAARSPYYDSGLVNWTLAIHLLFAIPTPLIWIFTMVQALRRMPNPPRPGDYSRQHRFWGWTATAFMGMTALTGWVFYYVAFVA
jgi:uncharacterized membrane protein YozB (DUF420 family)